MLILGFWAPLFRADFIWFIWALILYIATGNLGTIILAFFYNKIYIKSLLAKGYEPANDESKALLDSKGIIYKLSNSSEKSTILTKGKK
jgi:membrane protein insertase Oxa1/YidC/SpoIIIJ